MTLYLLLGLAVVAALVVVTTLFAVFLRRVVPTNEVHIVQSKKTTVSFGKGEAGGNVYYEWPSWIPVIGITKIVYPTYIFDLPLRSYEAYDKERVPFAVDVTAFFKISDPNTAAQRVASFQELHSQLTSIVQGAVRTVLASHDIDSIMLKRSEFGEQFTAEVKGQLVNWGVESVKNVELMDIRDVAESKVIANIMAKRMTAIERESRVAVAENKKVAQMAEIEATREVDLQKQQAEEQVGKRTAEKEKNVGVANEMAEQEVKEQQRITKAKEMAVLQVQEVQSAEIDKEVNIVKANEHRQTAVIAAEGDKQREILIAEGKMEAVKRAAEGIAAEGAAKAEAEKAMQLAPVQAQITLAKEIGSNDQYQTYLIRVEQIKAAQAVGEAQAGALKQAEIKVISNVGTPSEGLTNVMDLFSAKGGLAVGAMLESLSQTPAGRAAVETVVKQDLQ